MKLEIRGRKLGENISNEEALERLEPVLESMEGLSAGNSKYHKEEDLLEHSLMVYDEMLEMRDDDVALITALCHDIGKIVTQIQDNDAGHDHHGEKMVEIIFGSTLSEKVSLGVGEHMRIHHVPVMNFSKIIQVAQRLDSEERDLLLDLAEADKRGRIPRQEMNREEVERMLGVADEVLEKVNEEYSVEKRDSSLDDYNEDALDQMVQQDRVELFRELQ